KSRRMNRQKKIKEKLKDLGFIVSRRRIGRIMAEQGLVSKYTIVQYKPMKTVVNEEKISNRLNREFDEKDELEVVVSDLTYVRVGKLWHCNFVLIYLIVKLLVIVLALIKQQNYYLELLHL